jgi:hypothetical protein
MEFSLTGDIIDGYAKITGGVVIGRTSNTEDQLDSSAPHGIITPRTDNFSIEGARFFNFNWAKSRGNGSDNEWSTTVGAAALGTCSHCFHSASTDSGAR